MLSQARFWALPCWSVERLLERLSTRPSKPSTGVNMFDRQIADARLDSSTARRLPCQTSSRPEHQKFPFSERRRGTGPASAGLNGEFLGRTTYRTSCFASVDPEADASRRKLRATLHEGSQPCQPVNVREVGDSFTQSGRPVAAFTPLQIQFSVRFFL